MRVESAESRADGDAPGWTSGRLTPAVEDSTSREPADLDPLAQVVESPVVARQAAEAVIRRAVGEEQAAGVTAASRAPRNRPCRAARCPSSRRPSRWAAP